jgi:hypothetical protein
MKYSPSGLWCKIHLEKGMDQNPIHFCEEGLPDNLSCAAPRKYYLSGQTESIMNHECQCWHVCTRAFSSYHNRPGTDILFVPYFLMFAIWQPLPLWESNKKSSSSWAWCIVMNHDRWSTLSRNSPIFDSGTTLSSCSVETRTRAR